MAILNARFWYTGGCRHFPVQVEINTSVLPIDLHHPPSSSFRPKITCISTLPSSCGSSRLSAILNRKRFPRKTFPTWTTTSEGQRCPRIQGAPVCSWLTHWSGDSRPTMSFKWLMTKFHALWRNLTINTVRFLICCRRQRPCIREYTEGGFGQLLCVRAQTRTSGSRMAHVARKYESFIINAIPSNCCFNFKILYYLSLFCSLFQGFVNVSINYCILNIYIGSRCADFSCR